MHEIAPDFKKAYSKANEILCASKDITTFPFSPKKVIRERSNIKCRSYSKAAQYGVDIRDFGSESATIVRLGSKSIIFYDDTKPENHIRFSMLHEFGHDYLKHDFSDKREGMYGKFEVETNFFSAQILMPEQILRELQRRGVKIDGAFLQNTFQVSKEAAEKRLATLAKTNYEWKSREEKTFDDVIMLKFFAFIENICPQKGFYDYEYEEEMQNQRDRWY